MQMESSMAVAGIGGLLMCCTLKGCFAGGWLSLRTWALNPACGAPPVHATATKDSARISLDTLADICAAVDIPVVAIGGIDAGNAAPPVSLGCAGVAVVSAIFGAEDPAAAARELRAVVDAALGF